MKIDFGNVLIIVGIVYLTTVIGTLFLLTQHTEIVGLWIINIANLFAGLFWMSLGIKIMRRR